VTLAPSGEQHEITHGGQHAVVVEVGGGLRSYRADGEDVLDGYGEGASADGGRGQPLIPWPNRLRDGRYEWDGEHHQLPLSEPERANAIHGLVRWRNWHALDRAPDRVTLGLTLFPTPGYPFTLELELDYALAEDGLTVTTRATNAGERACPYGVGFHPYLGAGGPIDAATLIIPARRVLITDERAIPTGSSKVAGTPLDFRGGRELGATVLDHCFTDLHRDDDGRARITLAGAQRTIDLWQDAAYGHVMVYTGDGLSPQKRRQGVAVEPMSCPPDAFASGEALIRLEPGERHTAQWGIAP
jgi:aldose 1-epimerase